MKRVSVIICILLCFVLTDKAHAQRCLPSTKGLRITAGMTDGFHTADKRNELGYHFGMGMDRYVNGCHKWVFGGEYLLANQVVLLFHARERCLWGNDSGHFHFQFGVGLKIILN